MYNDNRSSTATRIGASLLLAVASCILLPLLMVAGLYLGKVGFTALVLGIGFLLAATAKRLRAVAMRAVPSLHISTASPGYVEVSGHAAPADEKSLRDPLTNEPCLWFGVETAKREYVRQRYGLRHRVWLPIKKGSSSRPFVLRDTTGTCVVMPEGAEFNLPLAHSVRQGEDLEYRAWRIRPGDFVSVVGQLVSDPSSSKRYMRKPKDGHAFVISNQVHRRVAHTKTMESLYFLGAFFVLALILLAAVVYRMMHG